MARFPHLAAVVTAGSRAAVSPPAWSDARHVHKSYFFAPQRPIETTGREVSCSAIPESHIMYFIKRNRNRLILSLFLVVFALDCTGCKRSHRESETQAGIVNADAGAGATLEPSAENTDRQILDFVASGEKGSSLQLTGTKWGELITITVGESYFSALGDVGRKAKIFDCIDNLTFDISIVEANNRWQYAPDVLAPFKNG